MVSPTHSSNGVVTNKVAASLKVRTISSEDALHGPAGSSVVKVNTILPAIKSPALGVYVAFNKLLSSKVPVPLVVHEAEVAEPPIDPLNVISSSEQIDASTPAET